MKLKMTIAGLIIFLSNASFAAPSPVIPVSDYPKLNTVSYQLSVEKWIDTQTAKVNVSIDGSLNQQGLDKLQGQIAASLKTLAVGDWRIIEFSRSQDQSGLEQVHVVASARLPSAQVVNIRTKTESLTRPGLKYKVDDIQYVPTQEDIQATEALLRTQLYQKIQQEIGQLNKTFDGRFYLNYVEFVTGDAVSPLPEGRMMKSAAFVAGSGAAGGLNTNYSQKITLTANVILASTVPMK